MHALVGANRTTNDVISMMKTLIVIGLLAVTAAVVAMPAEAQTTTTCQSVPGVVTACASVTVDDNCTGGQSCTISADGSVSSP